MIKIYLSLIFVYLPACIWASDYKPVSSQVESSEYSSITGIFYFTVNIEVKRTVTYSGNLEFELPNGWTANSSQNLAGNTYNKGQTFILNITVNYPVDNIPYYSQRIRIFQFFNVEFPDSTTGEIQEVMTAMVYFTPYSTVEIWNPQDYYNLPRRWHLPEENYDTQRLSFAKSLIPVSDIDTSAFLEEWYSQDKSWDEVPEFKYVTLPGLGYDVLMIQTDTADSGDGIDSIGTGEKKTYTGTVTGHLSAWIQNDIGVHEQIPLAGIKVMLREKDATQIQDFGETYSDENGSFTITYSKSQALENNNVELFLEFKSKTNDTYKITGSNFWGNLFEVRTVQWSAPQNAGTMTKNCVMALNASYAEPFKAIHWARRGYQYFANNEINLHKNLRIRPYATGSYYESSLVPPLFEPTIHLADGDGDRENTTYHEFGHATMHKLQGNNMIIPYGEEGFSHTWTSENTSRLAWTEGWANAIQMILDAAYWREDSEYGMDEGHQNNPYFEERNHFSWEPSDSDDLRIVNGFRSEYYIACAIYDLWDGANRDLPLIIPVTNNYFRHGWNDTGQENGWRTTDDVELGFYTLCRPLMEHQTGNGGYFFNEKCANIQDYYLYLLDLVDCKTKSDISRVFRENRVQWDITEYERNWNITPVSSDYIRKSKIKDETGYIFFDGILITNTWTDFYQVNFFNDQALNTYGYSAWPSKDLKITDPLWLGIWDDESSVYRQSELYINDEIRADIIGMSTPHGDYETCGCIEIDVRNGKLEIGGSETTATLTINDCSTLRIGNHGSLVINDNSTLIIECNASFIYDEGATIILNGDNAQLIIKGGLEIGSNAIFSFQGTGSLTKLSPSDIVIPHSNSLNSSFIVESGTSMTLVARNIIRLKPGFHAKTGCYFRAYIDPNLSDCYAKSMTISDNINSNQTIAANDNSYNDILKWETTNDTTNKKQKLNLQTRLIGNYPNPYTGATNIKYKIGEECPVYIFITDISGLKISELVVKEKHEIGEFEIEYKTSILKSGIYFYTLQTDKYFQTKRMIKF